MRKLTRQMLLLLCLILSVGMVTTGCGPAGDGPGSSDADAETSVKAADMKNWFGGMVPAAVTDEKLEKLAGQMVTVIDESQTIGGTTVTLNAAMRDQQQIVLSFLVEGDKELKPDVGEIECSKSWVLADITEEYLRSTLPPDTTEEEFQKYVKYAEEVRENVKSGKAPEEWSGSNEKLSAFEDHSEKQHMLMSFDMPENSPEQFTVHLEEFGGIKGPFDFRVDFPKSGKGLRYEGNIELTAADGSKMTLTEVEIYPLAGIKAKITAEKRVSSYEEFQKVFGQSAALNGFLWDDMEMEFSSKQTTFNGNQIDIASRDYNGLLMSPEDIRAIKIGDTWVKLDQMERL